MVKREPEQARERGGEPVVGEARDREGARGGTGESRLAGWLRELGVMLILFMVISQGISVWRSPALESDLLPDAEVQLIDGARYQLKPREGRPTLLYLWGTWCGVCGMQSPVIEGLGEDVEVLSIAFNSGSDAELEAWMAEQGYGFKVLNDRRGLWRARLKPKAYPTLLLFDSAGRIRFSEVGYTSSLGLAARLWWIR